MKVYNGDGSTLMQVTSLEQQGNNLVINGYIMGAMPIRCMLTPTEGRNALKLVKFKLLLFLLTFLMRS